MTTTIAETDLYAPVRDWLTQAGWEVQGEVKDCDVGARKGDDLVVVELKTRPGLRLLEQAVARQRFTAAVYVALPLQGLPRARRRVMDLLRVLRRLELGLVLVDLAAVPPRAEVRFHPLPYKPRKEKRRAVAVLTEMDERGADYNPGGSTRVKKVTAYRREAVFIGACLRAHGSLSPRALCAMGASKKAGDILRSNFYGWFERVAVGVYALSARGREELTAFNELIATLNIALPE